MQPRPHGRARPSRRRSPWRSPALRPSARVGSRRARPLPRRRQPGRSERRGRSAQADVAPTPRRSGRCARSAPGCRGSPHVERHTLSQRHGLTLGQGDVFLCGSVGPLPSRFPQPHPLADAGRVDALTDSIDRAGPVLVRDMGRVDGLARRDRRVAPSSRSDSRPTPRRERGPPRPWLGHRAIDDMHHVRLTGLRIHDCSHARHLDPSVSIRAVMLARGAARRAPRPLPAVPLAGCRRLLPLGRGRTRRRESSEAANSPGPPVRVRNLASSGNPFSSRCDAARGPRPIRRGSARTEHRTRRPTTNGSRAASGRAHLEEKGLPDEAETRTRTGWYPRNSRVYASSHGRCATSPRARRTAPPAARGAGLAASRK